jgi:HrpA-like RNA helicase
MSNDGDNIGILDPAGKYNNPLTGKPYSEAYRNLAKIWSRFPAYNEPEKIIDDIRSHNVILVVSGTGSGKTVLFPKYVLHAFDYDAKIAITLPKQLIAKSAAEFAADTLDVRIGHEVGYQYRGSGKGAANPSTKLLYCTDGTLVARILTDPELKEFDAALIDEAHERKVNIDFLLYLLRNVLKVRPEFKLVIMSATINQEIFKKYYQEFNYVDLSIGTKTNYPIKSIFIKEPLDINSNEYLTKGISQIHRLLQEPDKGGILFFVTSITETNTMCDLLATQDKTFKDHNICVPVYSGMLDEQQKIATDKDYYRGFVKDGRKVIIATNVAESSLTIEGITYIIDSGLELRSRFDPINRIDILEKTMITHAQAKQRMGRTGRTGPGTCYHLYTEHMFNEQMNRFPAPAIRVESISYEMIRLMAIPGISNVLELKNVLNRFIEPPDKKYIDAELNYLEEMGIISSTGDYGALSETGIKVVDLQLEPSKGLALIMGYRLRCFREVVAIYAVIDKIKGSIEGLFTLPETMDLLDDSASGNDSGTGNGKSKQNVQRLMGKFDKVKKDFSNKYGDHIAILKIFQEYEKLRGDDKKLNDWTYRYFLKRNVLESAYQTYRVMKYRYKDKLAKFNLGAPNQGILGMDLKYRVMACLMYGSSLNVLKIKNDKLETEAGNIRNIQLEKNSFVDLDKTKTSKLFYYQLFRYNNTPVRAKIVSKISKKSQDIIEDLNPSIPSTST